PVLGRNPYTPQNAAGMRTDPPVSVPSAKSTSPAATAAALPPLDPPAIRRGSAGLGTGPVCGLLLVMPNESSCMLVFPTRCDPAALSRATTGASRPGQCARPGVPAVVGNPVASMLSLTAKRSPARERAMNITPA